MKIPNTPMPIDFVLVRHGESEGNVVGDRAKKGDDSGFTEEFIARHSSQWRLTNKGREQAQAAGKWLRDNFSEPFGRHYTSEYLRAMETAGHLGLPSALWLPHFYLRERDWGELETMSHTERKKTHAKSLRVKKEHPLLWKPLNGTSLVDLCIRNNWILDTLHRECSEMKVVLVCHGEVMWGFRLQLERIPFERFNELDASKNPFDRIHNCQILHYTRRHPMSGELFPYLGWMRSICPWDTSKSSNTWLPIKRKKFTNDELIARVERVEPIYQ
jgi:NAD+ kinase